MRLAIALAALLAGCRDAPPPAAPPALHAAGPITIEGAPARPRGHIVFERSAAIYIMNADGNGQTNLTNNSAADYEPAWSPDRRQPRVAFMSDRDGGDYDIFVVRLGGGAATQLTSNSVIDLSPHWGK